VLRVGKWNHVPSFLQVKTLHCRTSLVYQFSSSKRVISYYTPGYSEYIEDICWFVDFGGRSNFISRVVNINWYFHEWRRNKSTEIN